MSGHNKWSKIKHKKTLKDKKKGEKFTKIIKKLKNTYILSKSNSNLNSKVQSLINKALSNNISRKTLYNAITNNKNKKKINITYEGYGPGGIAIILQCYSENKNKTLQELRCAFKKFGGKLGNTGSVMHLFKTIGVIKLTNKKNSKITEDKIIEIAIKILAKDIIFKKNNKIIIYTTKKNFENSKLKLISYGLTIISSKIINIPINKISTNIKDNLKFSLLIKMIKNFIEIKKIYHNGNC
ncbi:MAG: putative transcriptional regulator YebC [Candidatus Westeberhardia cardiocondylae]|nr:putative transcriptional regulator YebC [Candidatus Westeberhardia cardiocondylae]